MRIILALIQEAAPASEPLSGWTPIIDRYGVPFFVLCVLALFVWKVLWPFMAEQITASRQQVEKANDQLQAQLTVSFTARETALREFMTALERRDNEFAKIVDGLDNLAELIEDRKRQQRREQEQTK